MDNPIEELNKKISYTEMAEKTGYSKQYMQKLGTYNMEQLKSIPFKTLSTIEETLEIELINKLK